MVQKCYSYKTIIFTILVLFLHYQGDILGLCIELIDGMRGKCLQYCISFNDKIYRSEPGLKPTTFHTTHVRQRRSIRLSFLIIVSRQWCLLQFLQENFKYVSQPSLKPLNLLKKVVTKQGRSNKRFLKLAQTFSYVSVGIKCSTIGQAGEARQHSNYIDSDESSLRTLPDLNHLNDMHTLYG